MCAIGMYWVEARDTIKHPAMHRIFWPQTSVVPKLRNSDLHIPGALKEQDKRVKRPGWEPTHNF